MASTNPTAVKKILIVLGTAIFAGAIAGALAGYFKMPLIPAAIIAGLAGALPGLVYMFMNRDKSGK